ncbi:E3 ubiquitin-ligase RNF181-like [Brachionus plicatilis]|uniref:E3 ubiquitin-ligase RNF181-like n=1 Tax=Brachionus plicatilis TaxID=10195 RepID=A0A3M7RF50_BRAPC|nr:E3 ubiquitin-ligase RNF181-like [Brachionus plicatilis]
MASYFDEHNCEPLGENERPNEQLLLARLLVDSGIANALNLSFEDLSSQNLSPPISKIWLKEEFPKYCFSESDKCGHKCPICLIAFEEEGQTRAVKIPNCGHIFHCDCILKWFEKTSSCPLCRFELPTDDPSYEEFKRQKKREKIRQQEIEDLHNSMFS